MSHSVFTIVSAVRPASLPALRTVLAAIDADPSGNPYLRFAEFPKLHFASFTIFTDDDSTTFPPDERTLLVFENNVDGGADEHLRDLASRAPAGLQAIYECCVGGPAADAGPAALLSYLRRHQRTPNLYHVGTPYRLADTVRADRELRRFLDREADAIAGQVQGESPASVWERLRRAANVPASAAADLIPIVDWSAGSVSWTSRPEPRAGERFANWSVFAVLAIGAVALVAWMTRAVWDSQAQLTAVLVVLSVALGAWTSILLGWPVRSRWRDPLNICIWFGGAGWVLSLVPAAFSLAGLTNPRGWLAPVLLAIAYVIVFSQLVGTWTLPTAALAEPQPRPDKLRELTAQEDRDITNHMSAMVELRPGLHRRVSLWILLWTLKHTWFPTVLRDVMRGRLFNFATVHFAQWVMLDRKRYLFLSNYDHSWSRYLDDFGGITFGLARLWGQGECSPGLSSLERFKDFSRTWMRPYSVWYRAYPNTTVTQVWNNEIIRRGLLTGADDRRSRELLARLVASEER